jgi:hypothetical protein
MSFSVRGIGGMVTDVMTKRIPGWSTRFGRPRKPIEELEKEAMRAQEIKALAESPGWKHFQAFVQERKSSCQNVLESSTVLTQEKALELAAVQGRLKELRTVNEWLDHELTRGRETSQELAARKQPK